MTNTMRNVGFSPLISSIVVFIPFFFVAKSDFNKEEKIKALENLVTATELSNSSTKDGDYLSAQEPVSSEVARTGRLRRSTISKHVVEKATIGGSTSNFAPALISSTLQMSRLRF